MATVTTAAEEKLSSVYWLLRIGLGVGVLLAGVDKFFDLLAMWPMYLSPLAERLLPVEPDTFLRAVGVVEAAVGLAILTRFTRIAAYVAAAWLVGVALNLALGGHFWDLVVRDLELAASAFALGRLAEWRDELRGNALVAPRTPPRLHEQGARG